MYASAPTEKPRRALEPDVRGRCAWLAAVFCSALIADGALDPVAAAPLSSPPAGAAALFATQGAPAAAAQFRRRFEPAPEGSDAFWVEVPPAGSSPPPAAQAPPPTIIPTPAPQPAPSAVAASPNAPCALTACAARYRSFRARDCSFQPFNGPRRRCSLPPSSSPPARAPQPRSAQAEEPRVETALAPAGRASPAPSHAGPAGLSAAPQKPSVSDRDMSADVSSAQISAAGDAVADWSTLAVVVGFLAYAGVSLIRVWGPTGGRR